eukprot:92181-Pyramimonas_sp.AAC.1
MSSDLDDLHDDRPRCKFGIHCVRADASNTSVRQKCSINVTELESHYALDPVYDNTTYTSIADSMDSTALGPLLAVKGKTAHHAHSSIAKQVEGAGATRAG